MVLAVVPAVTSNNNSHSESSPAPLALPDSIVGNLNTSMIPISRGVSMSPSQAVVGGKSYQGDAEMSMSSSKSMQPTSNSLEVVIRSPNLGPVTTTVTSSGSSSKSKNLKSVGTPNLNPIPLTHNGNQPAPYTTNSYSQQQSQQTNSSYTQVQQTNTLPCGSSLNTGYY